MAKFMKHLLGFILLFVAHTSIAQPYSISGKIIESNDTTGLIGVTIVAYPGNDSANSAGGVTDETGSFIIPNLQPGNYTVKASYIGFNTFTRSINIINSDVSVETITLLPSSTTLKTVNVTEKQVRVQQLGDTSQFNAGAYKTNPDANAEDLVTKMPGVTSESGTLKVNGEDVKRILVDGKPFFGDDPNTAMKNLPAEVIDKIQVFDRLSDQAQFTGFDDGNAEKTINIVTKPGKNNGQFGKVYAGYGTDNRYIAGANINLFKGVRKISLIGLSNNINQQNFSTEDLAGVVGTSSGQGRGGMAGGQRGGNTRGGGGPRGDGGASNFLVGQQGGITGTNAIGLNYTNEWNNKLKVNGSYFFNNTNNDNNSTLTRNYVLAQDSGLVYNENSISNTKNTNHRLNARIEYNIDSNNSLIITPRVSIQNSELTRQLDGSNTRIGNFVSSTSNTNNSQTTAYSLSNDILYRHKFAKKGRTASINITTQANDRSTDGTTYSLNQFVDSFYILDQVYNTKSNGYTLSSSINYTEPITSKSQLQIEYRPSLTNNIADKQTYDRDTIADTYTDFNNLLSNKYNNTYTSHTGGLSYRFNNEQFNFMAGVNGQYATLEGEQEFPYVFSLSKDFQAILPQAMFNYKFSKSKNLRIMYRTSTNAPSVSQLQNVVDNTNPLLLTTGNPDLKQDYQHRLILRYGATNTKTARNFFVFAFANFANNYIGNATYIPTSDSTFTDGIRIARGGQLSRPVNLDKYFNARSFITYGMPVEAIKSNLNLNLGGSYTHTPALINNAVNFSNNYSTNAGFTLGSNISENVDFTLGYTGNYSVVRNTLQTQLDNTYFSQATTLKFNWIFLKGFVFNTNFSHNLYTGVTQDFTEQFFLWNASFGYKFLKDRSLEAKITAFDILNQNRAFAQTSTETYNEDSRTDVLQRYLMLQVTYTLRNFKK